MTNNAVRSFLETQDLLRRQLAPFEETMKAFTKDTTFQQLLKEADRHRELMRAALGPLDELRRTGLLREAAELSALSKQARDLMAEVEKTFRLPDLAEATKAFREFEASGAAKILERYREQSSELQRAMEAMRTPWLDVQDRLRSVTGFVELQGIGYALRTMPPFDARLADALRSGLGDWQAKINWPSGIFTDPLIRTKFYADRGLDPALTAFPAEAFQQSLGIAGLRGNPPAHAETYDLRAKIEKDEGEDDQEIAFDRSNVAHDRLQRFETQVRKFIDERMKAAFGEDWIKHRVPGEIRKTWLEKRQKSKDNGEREWPLIAYADFADYVPIITRSDNWEAVFKPVFRRQTLVQESFQRLYPIRICTMHARLITQDDELYLYVETKRVLSVMGITI